MSYPPNDDVFIRVAANLRALIRNAVTGPPGAPKPSDQVGVPTLVGQVASGDTVSLSGVGVYHGSGNTSLGFTGLDDDDYIRISVPRGVVTFRGADWPTSATPLVCSIASFVDCVHSFADLVESRVPGIAGEFETVERLAGPWDRITVDVAPLTGGRKTLSLGHGEHIAAASPCSLRWRPSGLNASKDPVNWYHQWKHRMRRSSVFWYWGTLNSSKRLVSVASPGETYHPAAVLSVGYPFRYQPAKAAESAVEFFGKTLTYKGVPDFSPQELRAWWESHLELR